jgi:murein DD-endopeptidase MepM/ murein hydrolase activator NlpD
VEKGDVIALVGNTGNSIGPHCHFEIRVNSEAVDPLPYLNPEKKMGGSERLLSLEVLQS